MCTILIFVNYELRAYTTAPHPSSLLAGAGEVNPMVNLTGTALGFCTKTHWGAKTRRCG